MADNVLGLKFMLDVGTLRLDQQVACQRYRQNPITAKSFANKVASLRNFNVAFAKGGLALAA